MVILQVNAEPILSTPAMVTSAEHVTHFNSLKLSSLSPTSIYHTPSKLLNHVGRINHRINEQIKLQQPEALYAALLDLFIVLEQNGREIREKMLNKAQAVLKPQKFEFLQQQLDQGIAQLEFTPQSDTSMLIEDFLSDDEMVHASGSELDTLQIARDLLEHGQIDSARSVLESAVINGEVTLAVHQDLLDIYRQTNDNDNFSRVLKQQDKNGYTAPQIWHDLIAFFDAPKDFIYA